MTFADAATPFCKAQIQAALDQLNQRCTARGTGAVRKPSVAPCWRETPEIIRKMVVHLAGLDRSVIEKIDRELSEEEKSKIRYASKYMSKEISALVAL